MGVLEGKLDAVLVDLAQPSSATKMNVSVFRSLLPDEESNLPYTKAFTN
jgi:hypothetical protein